MLKVVALDVPSPWHSCVANPDMRCTGQTTNRRSSRQKWRDLLASVAAYGVLKLGEQLPLRNDFCLCPPLQDLPQDEGADDGPDYENEGEQERELVPQSEPLEDGRAKGSAL